MRNTMFPHAKASSGPLMLSKHLGGGVVPADRVEALIRRAGREGVIALIDDDITLHGDVLIDHPVHLKIAPGVTVLVVDTPTWTRGVQMTDRSNYYAGMFTFRPGSEGSVVEIWGVLDGNQSTAGTVESAPVSVGGILVVGHGYDLGHPSLTYLGRPQFVNVAEAGTLIRTSFWGAGEWQGAEFLSPQLPTNSEDPFPRTPTAQWDDPDLPLIEEA
ncbi:hypothetical protein [Pelagimonas varians]|uniref:Uncharacterized protein n=1 Tax=Pelagimonas varians TaxID=696760 RepID=A0A238KCU9_9RHOB|nr:hypothetical protein [Pelagimonas varians]PYG29957.1 hypothetical protein C8N36_107123 [Pelagimonas varians]SMX40650.1 hypothetical protein PEV8663_02072 [Pelagimonas varians]